MTLGDSRKGKEVNEKWRMYHYADGEPFVIKDVKRISVSDSGNHYLTLGSGEKVIVAPGWRQITFEGEWQA